MLIYFLFSLIFCGNENIIKNPSFEEFDANSKLKYWDVVKESDISSDSHSGNNSLHWKPLNRSLVNYQQINVERNYQYEICIHYKIKNITALQFYILNTNKTKDYNEYYYSKSYRGTNDWEKGCYETGPLKRSSDIYNKFKLGIYTHAQIDETGEAEAFIDDISMYRIKDIIKIGVNNDRDEVYDLVNVICQIKGDKGNNTLNDWDLLIRIKDGNKIIYEKEEKIISSLFIIPINIVSLNLKENNFYYIEGIVRSRKDNTTDINSYPFKKINKIKREVKLDKYGRMFINDELFFPFGIYLSGVSETDLIQLNKTHLNFILPYNRISKKEMDMIYETQQGKIKVMYCLDKLYTFDYNSCSDLKEEENYKKFVDKINELKEHPALFSWYINDEKPPCFNRNLRNRTLAIHELDPNHPTLTVIGNRSDATDLLNTTDILGTCNYPIGLYELYHNRVIRNVYDALTETYDRVLEGKLMMAVIQIFDWAIYYWNSGKKFNSTTPTLQEMRCMSWQGFAAGARGMIFYSLFDLFRMQNVSSFDDRWKDVIEFTDQIWEYKDVILSVEDINKIKYIKNPNVAFKQWKYNASNYIVVINLERNNQIFEIDLLNEYEINIEFGIGTIKKNGNNVTFFLEPIDVIMLKYIIKSQSSNLIIIIFSIIISIIIILIIGFFVRKHIMKKNKEINFINQSSQLMKEDNYE